MSLVTRDPATGLRRDPISYPDGQPPTPYGCRWCGTEHSGHGQRWKASVGLHRWEQPTREQVLARMRARRTARLNALPAQYHATTRWVPDPGGESADQYCADCGTSACFQWNRIYDRLQLRRWPRQPRGSGWGDQPEPF